MKQFFLAIFLIGAVCAEIVLFVFGHPGLALFLMVPTAIACAIGTVNIENERREIGRKSYHTKQNQIEKKIEKEYGIIDWQNKHRM